jgi:hypothetical protein
MRYSLKIGNIPYGLPIAGPIKTILKLFLPDSDEGDLALSLYLRSPINIKLDLNAALERELAGKVSLSTGEKHLEFTASSENGGDLRFLPNTEDASAETKLTTLVDEGLESIAYEASTTTSFTYQSEGKFIGCQALQAGGGLPGMMGMNCILEAS